MNSIKCDDCLIKFLALGNSGVGKTSLLYRYTDGTFQEQFKSTIGIDFKDKKLVYKFKESTMEQGVHLQIWDTAGQEKFRSLTAAFYRDAMGFLLVFDVTNEQSFLDVRSWLEQLKAHAYCEHPDVILCGNKCDLEDKRVVSEERAKEFASQLGCTYIETSASTGHNVEEAVMMLLDVVLYRMKLVVESNLFRKTTALNGHLEDQHSEKSGKGKCLC